MSLLPLICGDFLFMEKEIWKDIPNYENWYQASNKGNIRSIPRSCVDSINRVQNIKGVLLKPTVDRGGYLCIHLSKNNVQNTYNVHRLIAITFLENPNNLKIVNHIDGNKLNNDCLNLEWVSFRENICHSVDKSKTTSKYIGVSFNKHRNTWRSRITINSKLITIGSFKTEEEAYQARKNYEKHNDIKNQYS